MRKEGLGRTMIGGAMIGTMIGGTIYDSKVGGGGGGELG